MPRPILHVRRSQWAQDFNNNRHTELQCDRFDESDQVARFSRELEQARGHSLPS